MVSYEGYSKSKVAQPVLDVGIFFPKLVSLTRGRIRNGQNKISSASVRYGMSSQQFNA